MPIIPTRVGRLSSCLVLSALALQGFVVPANARHKGLDSPSSSKGSRGSKTDVAKSSNSSKRSKGSKYGCAYSTKGSKTFGNSKGKGNSAVLFADPLIAAVCPWAEPDFVTPLDPSLASMQKIPECVIEEFKEAFEENKGTVLNTRDYSEGDFSEINGAIEELIGLVNGSLLEPYPTPDYELGETDPEPYPFRTALPVLDTAKCNYYQKPYAIFIPATYEDAAATIELLNEFNEDFAILSGGHDYECQSATDKVLIITSLLNKIEFDLDRKTVTTGAGNLWSNIYDKIRDEGLPYGVMGAQCGLVSVSGYTLGGGYSWYMSRYGALAAETVEEVKVVLANGMLVTATRDNKYKELLWGLAGSGGQSLGLVVEFTFRMFDPPSAGVSLTEYVWEFNADGSNGLYSWTRNRDIMKAIVTSSNAVMDDEDLGTIRVRWRKHRGSDDVYQIFLTIPCKNPDMVTNCFPEQVYQPWIDLLQQYPPTEGPEREYYDTFNDFNLRRENDYDDAPGSFGGSERASHFISGPGDTLEDFIDASLDYFDPAFTQGTNADNFEGSGITDFQWYGTKNVIKDPSRTSFNSRAASSSWHVTIRSSSRAPDQVLPLKCVVRAWSDIIIEALGPYWHGTYLNYFDGTADTEWYFGENLPRLLEVKGKYDPHNFFKNVKGIAMNDVDSVCLKDLCPIM